MELVAICVVLVTCVTLIVMVIGAGVADWRQERDRRAVDLPGRLAPYDRPAVLDLRDGNTRSAGQTGAERYLAAEYEAARD